MERRLSCTKPALQGLQRCYGGTMICSVYRRLDLCVGVLSAVTFSPCPVYRAFDVLVEHSHALPSPLTVSRQILTGVYQSSRELIGRLY
jgi:hypothetical protein